MNSGKLRVAILGYGRSGGGLHAGAIEHNGDAFDLVAVCDIDPERCALAAQRFGCRTYEDYHAMLKAEALDLVSIVTRSDQHCAMTCDCLTAGINVLVTKPWAQNETEARRMIDAAERSGKRLLPWLPARWACDLRRLRELLTEGAIGDVFLVRRAVSSFGTRCDWQTERRYGGGYLLNWGPHIVDPPIQLLGSAPATVFARMMQTINPGDVEDVFMAMITLADGRLVHVEHTIAIEPLPSWIVQGTRGTLVVRDRHVKICKNTPVHPEDPTKTNTMDSSNELVIEEDLEGALYGDENEIYAEIACALRGESNYAVTPQHALDLTRLLDAIRLSAERGAAVSIDAA